jgi:hypothetical protein
MRHCVPKNAPAYHPADDIHEAFMMPPCTMVGSSRTAPRQRRIGQIHPRLPPRSQVDRIRNGRFEMGDLTI